MLDDVGGFLDFPDRLEASLTRLSGQDGAQFGDVAVDAVCHPEQAVAAVFNGGPTPDLEGVPGLGDGLGDEFRRRRVGSGDARTGLARIKPLEHHAVGTPGPANDVLLDRGFLAAKAA